MEPTVRNPRIESALALEAAWSSPLGGRPAGQFRPEIQSPGTEFLDAETGAQKSPVRRLMSAETGNVQNRRHKSPQKQPLFDRRRFPRFVRTGWWRQ
jgi:hypothetical protein